MNAELQREARRKKLNEEQLSTLQRQMRDKQEALAQQRLEKVAQQQLLRQRDDIDNQMEAEASVVRDCFRVGFASAVLVDNAEQGTGLVCC